MRGSRELGMRAAFAAWAALVGACDTHPTHVGGTGDVVPAGTATSVPSAVSPPGSSTGPSAGSAPPGDAVASNPSTSASSARHATWVYGMGEKGSKKPLSDVDPGGAKLLAFVKERHLTEVYLSTGTTPNSAAPLADPRTPSLVQALRQAGLRVEALLGSKDVHKAVSAVLEYNARQAPGSRFDGVHYDLEPWIGRGADQSWVPSLVNTYREAQRTLSGSGMTFAADIASVKFIKLPPADQKSLLDSASRLVLMAYEVPLDTVHRQYDTWIASGVVSTGSLMIAIRVQDFAGNCQNAAALSSLDAKYGSAKNYGGWATYAYNKYLDPAICTSSDCCQTP
jgi:hypothetical protein